MENTLSKLCFGAVLTIGAAQAEWVTLDDFESYNADSSVVGSTWTTTNSGLTATAVADPDGSSNQVMQVTRGSNDMALWANLPNGGIADNTTATLSFRLRMPAESDFQVVLQDGASLTWWQDEAGLKIISDWNRHFRDLDKELFRYDADTWYDVMMVIDNTNDEYTVHVQSDIDSDFTEIASFDVASFKSTVDAPIQTIGILMQDISGDGSSMYIDDIKITSGNALTVPEPSTAITTLLIAGALLLKRKR